MASLGQNIVANYIGRVLTAALAFLAIPFYLKFMGVEAYGLIGFYMTLNNVLGIFDFGIGSTMNRELARLSSKEGTGGEQRDVVRTLELIYWGIAIIAAGTVIFLAPYITHTWIKSQHINSISILKSVQLMGLSIAFQFPMSLYQGGLMGLQRQVLVNVILVFTGTLRSIGAILVLWLIAPSIKVFFAWQIIVSVTGSIFFLVAMWWSLPKHEKHAYFKLDILKSVWKYAAAISACSIIGVVMSQLDKVILSRMLTLKMFGYYSLAATVASAISMIIIPFFTAVFPRFVQLHELGKTNELPFLFHRTSQILSFLLFPVCAVFITFSKEIIFLWMHDPVIVENCYLIASLLVFGSMLNGIASIPCSNALAFGWPQLITYTNLIQVIIMIPLIIGMVYWLQGVGAAIAWIVLNSTYFIFMLPVFFRRFFREEQVQWYLYDISLPVLTAFSVCLISLLAVSELHSALAILVWLTITGIISLIVTGLILPHVRVLIHSWWIDFIHNKRMDLR